jgi:hypothetical protein
MFIATRISDIIRLNEAPDSITEISEEDLCRIYGASGGADYSTPQPYIEIRNQAMAAQHTAARDLGSAALRLDPAGLWDAANRWLDGYNEQAWAENNLNALDAQKGPYAPAPTPGYSSSRGDGGGSEGASSYGGGGGGFAGGGGGSGGADGGFGGFGGGY